MELLDSILNVDHYLTLFINRYGAWVYVILFAIIFSETGLVVTPFLPGDSLLFAIGAVAASGKLDIKIIVPALLVAAILGNIVNYHIGYFIGPKIFSKDNYRLLNKENLEKTNVFYEKHGGKAIILSRFLPIFRTFIPFIAGIGQMKYLSFMGYNLVGGSLWILAFTFLGYFFGNIPFVQNNFEIVIIGILIISLLPSLIEYIKFKNQSKEKMHTEN